MTFDLVGFIFAHYLTQQKLTVPEFPKPNPIIYQLPGTMSAPRKAYVSFYVSPTPKPVPSSHSPAPAYTFTTRTDGVQVENGVPTNLGTLGGQPGYREYCPDGVPAQGSCQTPGGTK